ncbi:MAG: IS1595 family transposase [Rhodothermaceae bacterium]|nr:IS1595 family transposase [Rhodothermaceae bacterium]MYG69922.1 IS1595 family transposase [Rhodothermaceae bacterium]MYJ43741.1 IS1595 family transposase [Rhodothermaceae bacterium]
MYRIRKDLNPDHGTPLEHSVEGDEIYVGGSGRNKHASEKLYTGKGTVGKVTVVVIKDRAIGQIVVDEVRPTDKNLLQGFVTNYSTAGAEVYTDEALVYQEIPREHETVNHSVGEWIDEAVHTNDVKSSWALLKRAYHGVYHLMSPKHLHY